MSDFLNDWWDDANEFLHEAFQPTPADVNELLFGFSDQVDSHAQDLFFDAFMNSDDSKWAEFEQYLEDEYGFLYDHNDHWEDYREWYSAA